MGKVTQYKCDGCGAEKREANHWWVVAIVNSSLSLMTLDLYEAACRIHPDPFGDAVFVLCGQSCATKKVSEFMAAQIRAADSQADGAK